MSYDSITNRGDYLSPHYLAEVLPRDLKKQGSLRTRWAEREKAGQPTPVTGTARPAPGVLRRPPVAQGPGRRRSESGRKRLIELNGALLRALGFPAEPADLDVDRAGRALPGPGRLRRAAASWPSTATGRPTPTPPSTPTARAGSSRRSRSATGRRSRPARSSPAGCSPPTSRPGTSCCCTAA